MRRLIVLLLAFLFCLQPLLIIAQESSDTPPEELPKALGTYLSAKEGLIKLEEDINFIQKLKRQVHWTEAADASDENLSIISYSAFAALRDSEKFHLYRLATKEQEERDEDFFRRRAGSTRILAGRNFHIERA